MSMTKTDKQALRGEILPPRYYLAECHGCGVIIPSNKLIEAVNFPDGDADVHCPHCNADDCDIMDLGTGEEPAAVAWNYQQKRIEALLDELEAKDKRISHPDQWTRDIEESLVAATDRNNELEKRIAELEASHAKLREGMASIYNAICADGASTSLSAILTFVKRAFEESSKAGIALDTGE
jgi:hypothetical protein